MYCLKCNRENKPEAIYCRGCGEKLDNVSVPTSSDNAKTLPTNATTSSSSILRAAAVGGVIIGGLLLKQFLKKHDSTPQKLASTSDQEQEHGESAGTVSPIGWLIRNQQVWSQQNQLRDERRREDLRRDQIRHQQSQDQMRQDMLRQQRMQDQMRQDMLRQQRMQDQIREQQRRNW